MDQTQQPAAEPCCAVSSALNQQAGEAGGAQGNHTALLLLAFILIHLPYSILPI